MEILNIYLWKLIPLLQLEQQVRNLLASFGKAGDTPQLWLQQSARLLPALRPRPSQATLRQLLRTTVGREIYF